jgi:hypothetical protein
MALGTNLPVFPAVVFTYVEPSKLSNIYTLLHYAAQPLI